MAIGTNLQIRGEGRPLSEVEACAMTDASLEAQWLAERLGGVEVLVRILWRRGINLSYYHLDQGGGVLCR